MKCGKIGLSKGFLDAQQSNVQLKFVNTNISDVTSIGLDLASTSPFETSFGVHRAYFPQQGFP